MPALFLSRPCAQLSDLHIDIREQAPPMCGPTEAVIRVRWAAINPSDVKATLGQMPQAVFPRIPGRDYVGVVEQGPAAWIGKTVFGSGGDVGITRDGSHATHLVLPQRALLEKPANLSDVQAATLGVPWVTAVDGYAKAGLPQPGDRVLVGGAMGKVGLAAASIARMHGATVVGIKRAASAPVSGHAFDHLLDLEDPRLTERLMDLSGGQGYPILFNTVGSPYLGLSLDVLAQKGRQVLISTLARDTPFDIFRFFRKELTFHGCDSLKRDTVAANDLLRTLVPHLASGRLQLPAEERVRVWRMADAAQGFRETFASGGAGLIDVAAG